MTNFELTRDEAIELINATTYENRMSLLHLNDDDFAVIAPVIKSRNSHEEMGLEFDVGLTYDIMVLYRRIDELGKIEDYTKKFMNYVETENDNPSSQEQYDHANDYHNVLINRSKITLLN